MVEALDGIPGARANVNGGDEEGVRVAVALAAVSRRGPWEKFQVYPGNYPKVRSLQGFRALDLASFIAEVHPERAPTCLNSYIPRMAYTATWNALADPHRRQALSLLRQKPRTVTELTAELGLSQPGTSKHLRTLREAGLVRVRVDAQRRVYELDPAPLAELDDWLAPYRRFWERRLDALGHHLDEALSKED
jgi:DNA-binding transcriptional ArsR family regulator